MDDRGKKLLSGCRVKVHGESMYPALKSGDVLDVYAQPEYYPGEIIVFYYCDSLLIHRIYYIDRGVYYCKGDHARRIEAINKQAIVGAVKWAIGDNQFIPISPADACFLYGNIIETVIFSSKGDSHASESFS